MGKKTLALALTAVVFGGGCLSNSYHVGHDELVRLAQLPLPTRGEQVRVVQRIGTDRSPGRSYRPRSVSAPDLAAIHAAHRAAIHGTVRLAAAVVREAEDEDLGLDFDGLDGGGAMVVLGVIVLTAGIVILTAAAATEGARWDGTVAVDPSQTLYVDFRDGSRVALPLWALTAEDAEFASHATIMSDQGYFEELERAPLDRLGGAGFFELGASGTAADRALPDGAFWPLARIGFGGFFMQELGFFLTFGGVFGDGLFNMRYGAELRAYPLTVGPFSLGLYGGAFDNHIIESAVGGGTQELHAFGWGAGAALQLELTTRLALTLRGGPLLVHRPVGDPTVTGEVTLGLSVY